MGKRSGATPPRTSQVLQTSLLPGSSLTCRVPLISRLPPPPTPAPVVARMPSVVVSATPDVTSTLQNVGCQSASQQQLLLLLRPVRPPVAVGSSQTGDANLSAISRCAAMILTVRPQPVRTLAGLASKATAGVNPSVMSTFVATTLIVINPLMHLRPSLLLVQRQLHVAQLQPGDPAPRLLRPAHEPADLVSRATASARFNATSLAVAMIPTATSQSSSQRTRIYLPALDPASRVTTRVASLRPHYEMVAATLRG